MFAFIVPLYTMWLLLEDGFLQTLEGLKTVIKIPFHS